MTPIAVRPKFVENIDVSVDILTAYTLDLNTTAQGTISTPTDVDFYKVHLDAGQTYTFALMGTGAHYLADSYLILRNASGTQIALDDDSGPGTNSKLTYTATVTGDYFLDVSGYPGYGMTGQYGLSFASGRQASFDLNMIAAAAFSDAAGQQSTWTPIGTPATITYGFRATGAGTVEAATFSQLSSQEMSVIHTILGLWGDLCNVTFQEVTPGGYTDNATILFGNYSNALDGAGAYAFYPGSTLSSASAGDVWLNLAGGISTTSIPIGSYSFFAIMHELGHALGLTHPGDYNAGPGGVLSYSASAQFIQDTQQYSVMSYWAGRLLFHIVLQSVP